MKENRFFIIITVMVIIGCSFFLKLKSIVSDEKNNEASRQEFSVQEIVEQEESQTEAKFEYANECSSKFAESFVAATGHRSKYEFKSSVMCKCKKNLGNNDVIYIEETFNVANSETLENQNCAVICKKLCPTVAE